MGFNKRKLEDQRRHAAEKEAAARRALDPQIIADAERLIEHWNERQACRCCSRRRSGRHRGRVLVPLGTLPGLPHHECD